MSGVVPHGCDKIPRPVSPEKEKTSQTFLFESTTQSDRERDSQKICRHAIQLNGVSLINCCYAFLHTHM